MALRHQNKKRSFLFVSKILGKHIPIQPAQLQQASLGLALQYAARRGWPCQQESGRIRPPHPVLIVGFAETATAMGHCFFDAFEGDVRYVHTTREAIPGWESLLYFQEEHSHAPEHLLYLRHPEWLDQAAEVILVDDEMTTGKTGLNLIRALDRRSPGKRYGLVVFLDWRGSQSHNPPSLDVPLECASLLRARFQLSDLEAPHEGCWEQARHGTCQHPWQIHTLGWPVLDTPKAQQAYLRHSGRFGISPEQRRQFEGYLQESAARLCAQRRGKRTLCLGTGEFMYLPLRLAGLLGPRVSFQATTRSPVLPLQEDHYAIQTGFAYPSLEGKSHQEYLYNVPQGVYDEVFLFVERQPSPSALAPLLCELEHKEFTHYHLVIAGPTTGNFDSLPLSRLSHPGPD